MVKILALFLFATSFLACVAIADGSMHEKQYLDGTLHIEYTDLVHIDSALHGRDILGYTSLDINFEVDGKMIRLARVPLKIKVPVFGYRNVEAGWDQEKKNLVTLENLREIKMARLGVIAELVKFEDRGFPIEELPPGFSAHGYSHVQQLGDRAANFVEKLFSKIKEHVPSEGSDDFGEESEKPFQTKKSQIRNGSTLHVTFDSSTKVSDIALEEDGIEIDVEREMPDGYLDLKHDAEKKFETLKIEDLELMQKRLATMSVKFDENRFESQRIALLAEEIALQADILHQGKLIDLASRNDTLAEAQRSGKESKAVSELKNQVPNYWVNEVRLQRLKSVVDRLQLIRDRSVRAVCQRLALP